MLGFWQNLIFFIVGGLGSLNLTVGLNSFIMEIDRIEYEFNANVMKHLSIDLKPSNGHKKIYGSFSFVKDISDFQITNWVVVRKNIRKGFPIYNISVGVCQVLNDSFGEINPIFKTILNLMKKYIQGIPSKCPLKKNKTFEVTGFYYDEEMFPPYIPEVNFTATLLVSQRNVVAIKLDVISHVESKVKRGFRKDIEKDTTTLATPK